MSDLFEKITTLVNAQLNDLLGRNPRSPLARFKLNAEQAEKNPRGSARDLRQRLEEAIDYEDELQARIDERMREVVELDKLVDEMLRSGDEFSAQRLQNQLNMKQQQLTIAESELRDHRLLTRHLMQELSALETALDREQRPSASERGPRSAAGGRTRIPIDGAATSGGVGGSGGRSILDSVSDKFEQTRANLESLLGDAPGSAPPERARKTQGFEIIDEEPDPRQPKPRKQDAADMNDRLSRLSKPADD
ncbi:MAG: hypothetical protein OXG85_13815 [Chloroflexi bacterium]|nr:hypothetical protein [Chloroflexota bacterium]